MTKNELINVLKREVTSLSNISLEVAGLLDSNSDVELNFDEEPKVMSNILSIYRRRLKREKKNKRTKGLKESVENFDNYNGKFVKSAYAIINKENYIYFWFDDDKKLLACIM